MVGNDAAVTINRVFSDGYKSLNGLSDAVDASIAELDSFMELLDSMGIKNAKIDLGIMVLR